MPRTKALLLSLMILTLGAACRDRKHAARSAEPRNDGSRAQTPAPVPPPSAPPPTDLVLSPAGLEALGVLMNATHFGGWAVRAAGTPTPVVSARRTMAKEE